MTENEELELEFYKNASALSVLERFEFSEKEKQLIRDAIRTANMENPRMKLIHESDKLLREVAKTRKPIITPSSANSTEALIKIEAMRLEQEEKNAKIGSFGIFDMSKTKLVRIAFFIIMSLLLSVMYYLSQLS